MCAHPLALQGVRYRASGRDLLRRNLLVYGLGGILVPFAASSWWTGLVLAHLA